MRSLLTLLALTLILTACADRQADIGSGGPTEPSPPPTEETPATADDATSSQAVGEDTPIPVEGEGDIGDGQGVPAPLTTAPDFGVSSETDSGSVSPYTFCWSTPTGEGASEVGACADGMPAPDALTLTGTDQLVVTYEEGELTAGATDPEDAGIGQDDAVEATELPVVQDNPGIWLVDISGLPTGEHVVMLAWYGDQGDAFTAFTLTVQR